MRRTGDPSWFEHRHAVPLTGREPVLGRLTTHLRKRGLGWLTVSGPAGSGVSRLLQEAERLLVQRGGPAPLWVHPVRDARDPLEALRRAVRLRLPGEGVLALQRAVDSVLPTDLHQRRVLAWWLAGERPARTGATLDPALVARLLARLSLSGPVLVDEVGDLDPDSLAVLRVAGRASGLDVIAGTTSEHWRDGRSTTWELQPLGESQVELMLRRWLRHPATARRLSGVLTGRCHGWPGRIVGAVRELGRQGCLAKEQRGVVFVRAPERWPDGLRRADSFHDEVRRGDPRARRVFDVVALQGGQAEAARVAVAAETTPAFVQDLVAEAVAARGGRAPGLLFAHRAARDRYVEQMSPARLHATVQRLLELRAAQADLHGEESHTLLSLRVLLHAGASQEAARVLHDLLDGRPETEGLSPWARDLLADVASALVIGDCAIAADAVALVAHHLWDVGRPSQARTLFARLDGEARPPTPVLVLARARAGTALESRAVLESAVPMLAQARGARSFDAWALLARHRADAGDTVGARHAWHAAGRSLPSGETSRRARWHEGLAECARSRGLPGLVSAHLRRAVRLRRAQGGVRELATALRALGEAEIRRERAPASLASLQQAARLHGVLGASSTAAAIRQLVGRVLLEMSDYDRAREELQGALGMLHPDRDTGLLPHLHLALADAYRGCGDLLNERHHGQEAGKTADGSVLRLRAAAVVARADLAAGAAEVEPVLLRMESDLRRAGCLDDADHARAVLFNAHLVADDPNGAEALLPPETARAMRGYAAARLDLTEGRYAAAAAAFQSLARRAALPVDLRAACYAHLAEAQRLLERHGDAREAAVAASALLEVRQRSRANDARLHGLLARVFGGVGEVGRAEGHRSAALRAVPEAARAEVA